MLVNTGCFGTMTFVKRMYARETLARVGKKVAVYGWVQVRRDHGKIVFVDLRDRTGVLQVVLSGEQAGSLRPEDVVLVAGTVKERPEKLVNPKLATGTVELQAEELRLIAKAESLPFDTGGKSLEVTLPTLLDYRTLSLRHSSVRPIFALQAALLTSFRESALRRDCTEIVVPTIVASATEGGAEVFELSYYGKEAYLAQSPQLYKQIMVGVFERVFTIAHAYRAEPSVTTRHLSEVTQLDIEIGFIEHFENLLDELEQTAIDLVEGVNTACKEILVQFGVTAPVVGKKIPRLTLRQAQELLYQKTRRDNRKEPDLTPEDERDLCAWSLREHGSDFVTVTHFPTAKKPFYTHPDPEQPEYSLSCDLLCRGLEWASGSLRVTDYAQLVAAIESRGMNPKSFELYLQAFRYGMPPEGGFSFGLERLTMQILKLKNIREASLFPRDMERVDIRLDEK